MEVAGDQNSRFTFDPYSADFPVWSPDGSRIVFATARDGPLNLYQKRAAAGNKRRTPSQSRRVQTPNRLVSRWELYSVLQQERSQRIRTGTFGSCLSPGTGDRTA